MACFCNDAPIYCGNVEGNNMLWFPKNNICGVFNRMPTAVIPDSTNSIWTYCMLDTDVTLQKRSQIDAKTHVSFVSHGESLQL